MANERAKKAEEEREIAQKMIRNATRGTGDTGGKTPPPSRKRFTKE